MEKLKNANPEQLVIHPVPGEIERKTNILIQILGGNVFIYLLSSCFTW